MILIGIDYDEGDQATYRGVTIGDKTLNTGSVVADFYNAQATTNKTIYFKSSVDHFLQDGNKYMWDRGTIIKNDTQ